MSLRIKQDQSRFRQIVRGYIKKHLKKYISQGELLGRQRGNTVAIPLPRIELPRFTFDPKETGGVGQGSGELGQAIGGGDDQQQGTGRGSASDQSQEHNLEVDVSLDELAEMLGEVLELPHIVPRGGETISSQKQRSIGIQTTGPDSLRHFKRTYKQALQRQLMLGGYNPERPNIVPIREDRRYRSFKVKHQPDAQAVIIYMMDVSGSMGEDQKEIVRIESFWIDTWLRHQYKGLQTRYIVHDSSAKEVDRYTFFHTRESGGTMISSAYSLCAELIETHFSDQLYNIYLFHFSDGDNWSADDTQVCLDLIEKKLLIYANMFGYGQVESPYGSGQFIRDVAGYFGENPRVVVSEIENKETIYRSIIQFFGKSQSLG